jgi:hypothetical protein
MNDNPTREKLKRALRNVTREAILRAIDYYKSEYPENDYDNWLNKDIYKYAILYEGQLYPPTYIMGLSTDINCVYFAGGSTTSLGVNPVFKREGFRIVDK